MKLLLVSSSFVEGKGYLEHCQDVLKRLLDELPDGEVVFIPYAANEIHWEQYLSMPEQFFAAMGQPFRSLHTCDDPVAYIAEAKIKLIFTGGGNSFLLTKTLQDKKLLEPIRQVVERGVGYMGTSAGSNIACPTMQTTNDMPIVKPETFSGIGLVNFQINPHFVSGSLVAGHRGETREDRINEYHEVNNTLVVGLPEPSWIEVVDNHISLGGADAVIFEKDKPQRVWLVGSQLNA